MADIKTANCQIDIRTINCKTVCLRPIHLYSRMRKQISNRFFNYLNHVLTFLSYRIEFIFKQFYLVFYLLRNHRMVFLATCWQTLIIMVCSISLNCYIVLDLIAGLLQFLLLDLSNKLEKLICQMWVIGQFINRVSILLKKWCECIESRIWNSFTTIYLIKLLKAFLLVRLLFLWLFWFLLFSWRRLWYLLID